MMTLKFPDEFIFGTSTSAYQIETSFQHDWEHVRAKDGYVFRRTTDHEKQYEQDAEIISSLAPHYRMSLMWSRLQRHPLAPLDETTKIEYHALLSSLTRKGVKIMMVIHHFANPIWFADQGGWMNEKNIGIWFDYARKLIDEFGHYVSLWNTFNEPNLYATMGFGAGKFPPFIRNIITARSVVRNMAKAHSMIYDYLKFKYPETMVGISHNCALFSAQNTMGIMPSKLADLWYMEYIPLQFTKADFFGMSYYTRVSFDPFAMSYLYTPEKIKRYKKQHDDIWEYYPAGLEDCIKRYWKEFKKPVIITENGVCSSDDTLRIRAIRDYMKIIHNLLHAQVDIRGYYHWTAWDNFEWILGPTFRFGLYECNLETMERSKRKSADIYTKLAYEKTIDLVGQG